MRNCGVITYEGHSSSLGTDKGSVVVGGEWGPKVGPDPTPIRGTTERPFSLTFESVRCRSNEKSRGYPWFDGVVRPSCPPQVLRRRCVGGNRSFLPPWTSVSSPLSRPVASSLSWLSDTPSFGSPFSVPHHPSGTTSQWCLAPCPCRRFSHPTHPVVCRALGAGVHDELTSSESGTDDADQGSWV